MENKICKAEQNLISKWSGGTTTQIYIYPENSFYDNRDFLWRISSASLELDETEFTNLKGFERIIAVLEGEVILSYEGERITRLSQYQQDRFSGSIKTRSYGKIKDFNLIYKDNCDAYLEIIELNDKIEKLELNNHMTDDYEYESYIFYCIGEFAFININGIEYFIKNEDSLVIKEKILTPLTVGVMGNGKIALGIVRFDEKKEQIQDQHKEKGTFQDFKLAAYLSMTNFRGSGYICKLRKEYIHDEILKSKIGKIENSMLTYIIGILGMVVVAAFAKDFFDPYEIIFSLGIWLIVDFFIINPIVYYFLLPKPVMKHMKKKSQLTKEEMRRICESDKTNEQAEKILKKYKITGRN